MTRNEILRRYPNASASFIRANLTEGDAPRPEPEHVVQPEPLEKALPQESHPERFLVRITSRRRKLLDKDNLYGGVKYFVDACRYAGAIPEDTPDAIDLEVTQEKVQTKEEEHTLIEVIPLTSSKT